MLLEPSVARLPERLVGWKGRIDEQGKPFDYRTEVKTPKSFRSVGGGIHFGETATPPTGLDLSGHALIGEVATEYGREVVRLVLRDGSTGREVVVDASHSPIAMKSLYRFASSGRNAAISIGWAMERTAEDRLDEEANPFSHPARSLLRRYPDRSGPHPRRQHPMGVRPGDPPQRVADPIPRGVEHPAGGFQSRSPRRVPGARRGSSASPAN